MKRFFTIKTFIFSLVLLVSISAFSFIAIKKAAVTCMDAKQCCRKVAPAGTEMLMDEVAKHFGVMISL